jgi:aspartyl-tRNA(Asn)/glutamyl-tRNA(Gln) amidotransferase subunit A
MIDEDVLHLPVTELSARIRARRLSPVELTEGYLDRIGRLGPGLNAFETVTADLARAQAREAESEILRGKWRGPLHGIPYGAKDLLATAGIRTTWGAQPLKDHVPARDATVILKLRNAGAILLGKLAMVEFAGGLGYRFADASVSGPGRNPWNPQRWTGGSSSGSGAAVAAGLVGFALGTETWGSILCPAAFCGITGVRPTYGRVSRAGAMACSYSFDKIGPLARSAADCRLVLRAIAGPDPEDPTTSDEPLDFGAGRPDLGRRELQRYRAALIPLDFHQKGAEPEVKVAFDRAVQTLRKAGLPIVETKLPEFPASEISSVIISAEAIAAFESFYKDGRVRQLKDPYAQYQPQINEAVTGADLVKAWRMRRALQEKVAAFFGEYDLILTPNFMSVAPPISEDLYSTLPYADPAGAIGNACGLPAIALPCGFGKDRMPVGFQIMAAPYEEKLLFDLGEIFQKETHYHRERPRVS